MALFVLGAGATRGAKFVSLARSPCAPPLDGDFFTQLQKVRNPKHRGLITKVMRDVVEVFGPNFDVTMETVFSTLEHTIRMLEITGETRAFKKSQLKRMRDDLVQAIAVALEESLTESDVAGHSSVTPKSCEFHDRLVRDLLRPGDDVISFNYDCVLDFALKDHGDNKWNPRYGYGFNLGAGGHLLKGDKFWTPSSPAASSSTVRVHKLHGSLHFVVEDVNSNAPSVRLKQHPYTKKKGRLKFTIIPPEWHKAYNKGVFAQLWSNAAAAIQRAEHVVVIGYSLPPTDLHATALFHTAVRRKHLKSLVVVNPDRTARRRVRTALQRGFTPDTRVLSFDLLEHFVAADRDVWGA